MLAAIRDQVSSYVIEALFTLQALSLVEVIRNSHFPPLAYQGVQLLLVVSSHFLALPLSSVWNSADTNCPA